MMTGLCTRVSNVAVSQDRKSPRASLVLAGRKMRYRPRWKAASRLITACSQLLSLGPARRAPGGAVARFCVHVARRRRHSEHGARSSLDDDGGCATRRGARAHDAQVEVVVED